MARNIWYQLSLLLHSCSSNAGTVPIIHSMVLYCYGGWVILTNKETKCRMFRVGIFCSTAQANTCCRCKLLGPLLWCRGTFGKPRLENKTGTAFINRKSARHPARNGLRPFRDFSLLQPLSLALYGIQIHWSSAARRRRMSVNAQPNPAHIAHGGILPANIRISWASFVKAK